MIGVPSGRVTLAAYNPEWPAFFEVERRRLADALGPRAVEIAHIGSTAIPGADAKPLIDIMLGVPSRAAAAEIVPNLEALGYLALGEFGIAGRQFLKRGEPTTHHIHAVAHGSDFWRLNLLFRDFMRNTPDALAAYIVLKRVLAQRFADNRDEYTKGKDAFIKQALHDAGWRGGFEG